MTYWNTLIPGGKQETLVRRCTKPNTGGLAKESHFRATDARYASASLVEMKKHLATVPREEASCHDFDKSVFKRLEIWSVIFKRNVIITLVNIEDKIRGHYIIQ